MRFNSTGDRLISTDHGGMMRLWDEPSGRQLHSIPASTRYAAFSPDDKYLAVDFLGGDLPPSAAPIRH